MNKLKTLLITTIAAGVMITGAQGQVLITTTGTNVVTENFNSFLGSSATIPTATGFSVIDTGAVAWGFQGIGTGSSNAGGIYAFGASAADYSFGFLRSSSRTGGLQFNAQNNTGATITELTFTFDYEQWRFVNTSGFTLAGIGAISAADFSSFGFTGSSTGTNGTPASTPITITLTSLNIADAATFGLEWTYLDAAGSDNGIAIDNFTVSAIPEPTSALLLGAGLLTLLFRRRR